MAGIQDNFVLLCNELDVDSILPFLRQKRLLTTEEHERLLGSDLSLKEKRERLLLLISRKGNTHLHKFCCCLVWSGQKELARNLGFDVNDVSQHECPTNLPPPPQPFPSDTNPPPPSHPVPSRHHFPAIPPVSQRSHPLTVLIAYAKDNLLQDDRYLPPSYQRSADDYCDEVEKLVDTLTLFSGVAASDGSTVASFRCVYDDSGTGFVPNWLLWFEEALRNSDCILLLCSPLLSESLSMSTGTLQMARGLCSTSTLNNYMAQKCFIPVFLNMPSQPEWTPMSLRAANSYELNVTALHQQLGDIDTMTGSEFGEAAVHCFQTNRQLQPLNQLLQVLKRELPPPEPSNPVFRLPNLGSQVRIMHPEAAGPMLASQSPVSEVILADIAPIVANVWEHLGVKLGVPFAKIQAARTENPNLQSAVLAMLHMWQVQKGKDANRLALKTALLELQHRRVAMKHFPDD